MDYLWESRLGSKLNEKVKKFTYSIDIDKKLALYDIKGSIVHAQMLEKIGILSKSESKIIIKGLKDIKKEIEKGKFIFKPTDEDIHTAIERRLVEITGKIGEKIHTARSRNDQIVLDEKMYLKDSVNNILFLITKYQISLLKLSEKVFPYIFTAYTHLQQAQPLLLSHYLIAHIEMAERDKERFEDSFKRIDILPLGAGACCGTSIPVDREFVAKKLGFSKISGNSIDTVSDRDFIIETASNCGILMVHLSRLCEDFILWNTEEFGFLEIPDEFATGSSIMPQKKNPDIFELIRGKTSTVIGDINSLFVLEKGLPLSYNRDLQEDKRSIFEIIEITSSCLEILSEIIPKLKFKYRRMKENISPFTLATDLVENLVKKGVPFRSAYNICGQIVKYCIKNKKDFNSLSLEEYRKFSPLIDKKMIENLTVEKSVEEKISQGGTSQDLVKKEIAKWKRKLKRYLGKISNIKKENSM